MAGLDRTRPYAEIHDNGKVTLAQDGVAYSANGDRIVDEAAEGPLPDAPITSADRHHEQPPAPPVTTSGAPAKVDANDMRLAANRALKTQMEAFGEPWQGVEHARKFLGVG